MDYNINIKQKSGGSSSSSGGGSLLSPLGASGGARKKAVEASQKSGGILQPNNSEKKMIDSNIKLTASISKLTKSIDALNSSVKKGGFGGGGGGGGFGGDHSSGMGSIGSAAGYIGIPIAIAGFAIQKINQVGNAYIQKTSEYKSTIGINGAATGHYNEKQGMYLGVEVANAYKASRMATGSFSGGIDKSAFRVGTVFGENAETVGRQSGLMERYGVSYSSIANQGLGSGIETDLPKYMEAIASEMEDSVKNGVNASSLSTDLGQEMSSLTAHTQTKSVEMAVGLINKFKNTKEGVSSGHIGDIKSVMSWRAAQNKMLTDLNDPNKKETLIASWEKEGTIDPEMATKLRAEQKLDMQSINSITGAGVGNSLIMDTNANMTDAEALRLNYQEAQKYFGKNATGRSALNSLYGEDIKGFNANFSNALNPELVNKQDAGKVILDSKFDEANSSKAMLGVGRQQRLDQNVFKYGASFAEASIAMQDEMNALAGEMMNTVSPALKKFAEYLQATTGEQRATDATNFAARLSTFGLSSVYNYFTGGD